MHPLMHVCLVCQGRYKQSLLKAFKRTTEEGRFAMVIVDAPNVRVEDFKEYWTHGQVRPVRVGLTLYHATYAEIPLSTCSLATMIVCLSIAALVAACDCQYLITGHRKVPVKISYPETVMDLTWCHFHSYTTRTCTDSHFWGICTWVPYMHG